MEQTAEADNETTATAETANRVFAVTLFTDDLDESKRFYRSAFAMPIVHEDPTSVAFAFPNLASTSCPLRSGASARSRRLR